MTQQIFFTNVSPSMTYFSQPLDLCQKIMARKFNDWFTVQVDAQLQKGVPIDEIDIKLHLSLLKPLHATWMTILYDHMLQRV